jgi:glucose/arabinose dehydrogenase
MLINTRPTSFLLSDLRRMGLRLLLLWLVLAACSPAPEKTTLPEADPDHGGLKLLQDFGALVVADSLGRARHLAVRGNGDVYVKLARLRGDQGIVALRDADGDGRADRIGGFGDFAGTGIRFYGDHLYASSDTAVYRFRFEGDELLPARRPELVVSGFPAQRVHAAKPLAFDGAGHLYVAVGAPNNACEQEDFSPESPGIDPCPYLERHAGIWRFDAGATGQDAVEHGHRYATGLRNALALCWDAASGALYGADHGRDQLGGFWPQLYSPQQNADLPAEVLHRIAEGADYGWPYCYFDPYIGAFMRSPEYGGDGLSSTSCEDHPKPLMDFPAHLAPNDLLFYSGSMFPLRYRHGAFIAFHGSWNRAPFDQGGFFVAFIPFRDGAPAGPWEIFATGFAGSNNIKSPADARHRPMGLAEGPDGSLYISDSVRGRIWRIIYYG